MKKVFNLAVVLFGFFGVANFAEAKNLYVNNSGNPSCSDATTWAANGAGSPWCTLGRALWGNANRSTPVPSQAATAGDTVIVSAGTYTAPDTGSRFAVAFNPVNEGTSDGNRIIIQASGTVNLRSTGTLGGPVIGANNKDYITWDGFAIDETTYTNMNNGEQSMVMFVDSAYGTVKNCTLRGTTTSAPSLNHAGIFYHGSTNGYVYNNTIYNVYGNTGDSNTAGIYSYGLNTAIIEHNHIYNSRGGIFHKEHGNSNITIRYNKLHDLQLFGIRSAVSDGENQNIIIYQNEIYNIANGYAFLAGYMQGTGNRVVNNTISNVRAGYFISANYNNNDMFWHNNILHTAGTSAIYTEDYGTTQPTDHFFEHNAYYGIPSNCHWSREGSSCNSWATWTVSWAQDRVSPQGINGVDPLFVNAATGDFRLQPGSPARTLGVDILDLDGDGNVTDIIPAGAYITGNEVIGLLPSNTPTLLLSASPTAINPGNSSTLSWNSANVTSCTASGAWTGARATSGTQSVSPTSTSTYTLTCTGTNGSVNQSATVTVGDTTPPTSPSGLAANATSSSSITVSWNPSTDNVGVTGYIVERCQGPITCTTFSQVGTPSASPFVNSGLTMGTGYSYHVRAVDAAGNFSPWSNVVGATTQSTTQVACNTVTPSNFSQAAYNSYGAPYDLFASNAQLVDAKCTSADTHTIAATIGKTGDTTRIVYTRGYYFDPGINNWAQYTSTCTGTLNGDWCAGPTTATITDPDLSTASAGEPAYFVGMVCSVQGGGWKCGCRDTVCNNFYWQIQGAGQ